MLLLISSLDHLNTVYIACSIFSVWTHFGGWLVARLMQRLPEALTTDYNLDQVLTGYKDLTTGTYGTNAKYW